MKKILSAVIAAAMIVTVALSLTACGEKPAPAPAPAPAVEETTAAPAAEETTAAPVVEETTAAPVVEETTAAAEVLTVAFGDFEGQKAVSKSIQNLECTGKTVEIEGISDKVGSHYSIGQKNDAGEFTGTTYEFDGEYPASGAHVKLVGTVVTEGVVSKIVATSVEVVE